MQAPAKLLEMVNQVALLEQIYYFVLEVYILLQISNLAYVKYSQNKGLCYAPQSVQL